MPHLTEMPNMEKMEKMKKNGKMKFCGFDVRILDDQSIVVDARYEGDGMYDHKSYSYKDIDSFMGSMKKDFFSHRGKEGHLARND